jgi:hypothetical protein
MPPDAGKQNCIKGRCYKQEEMIIFYSHERTLAKAVYKESPGSQCCQGFRDFITYSHSPGLILF